MRDTPGMESFTLSTQYLGEKIHSHRREQRIYDVKKPQRYMYCANIKIFNSLPSNLRSPMNKKAKFKVVLRRYLNTHSFYSVEELLTFKNYS